MTTGQVSEMKALLAAQNEQAKVIVLKLGQIGQGVADLLAQLASLERRLSDLEERNGAAAIFERLVQRGTVTREEADKALEAVPA